MTSIDKNLSFRKRCHVLTRSMLAAVLSTRYITSTYLVLNSLENSNTDAEKSFAIFSEFVRDFILGTRAVLVFPCVLLPLRVVVRCMLLSHASLALLLTGLVAGLITTVSMSMNTFGEGSQEGQLRLRDLKNWMQKKKLPKELQMPITEYCHEIWNNRSGEPSISSRGCLSYVCGFAAAAVR